MIEAVCDGCGRRITLSLSLDGCGFHFPRIWKIETQSYPDKDELIYKTFCFDCRIKDSEAKE